MILAETFDYYLIGPKIVSFILFILAGIKIYSLNQKYSLNKYYLLAMISWGIYILMDTTIWVVVELSPTWYKIGNIFRDVQMIAAVGLGFFIYNAQKIIDKGENSLYNARYYVELFILLALTIILIYIDEVRVYDDQNNYIIPEILPISGKAHAQPYITFYTAVLSSIPVIIYTYAIIRQYSLAKNKIKDANMRRRMNFRALGLLFILFGIIYFIIQNMINWQGWFPVVIGYSFWIIAPLLIWYSTNTQAKD